MNIISALFLFATVTGILVLPRRWSPLPLLMGACYMTNAQSLDIGPFHFTVLRVLLLVGFIRAKMRGERLPGGLKGLDMLIIAWGTWLILASVFHKPLGDMLVTHLGMAYNVLGIYFLLRIFCRDTEDLVQVFKITALLIVPVALEMINEVVTHRNMFGFLGGVPMEVLMREGKYRAQGPFGHPILAGTVGSLCVPFMLGIWPRHRLAAKVGLVACLAMAFTCGSSGPLMTFFITVFGVVMWRWRRFVPLMCGAAVVFYFACNILMTRPAYYLLEKIDLTGSSSSYHRAAIIEAGNTHLSEWWLGGTDYTRHWMPYGVSFSEDHADITNHYLFYGIHGGVLIIIIFNCALWTGFRYVHQTLKLSLEAPFHERFLIWCTGAALFGHVATMVTVAYFDQSVMFLYLNLAVIGSIHGTAITAMRARLRPSHRSDLEWASSPVSA
ncbi:MAG: hypothetical protein JWM88_1891 [Verrucomicrobia bacterium]|nr:hypothetical protein [Verrucomicrobiota bacterium]